jgi:dihydrodipicolinate synthase/N-acetylneuraminate lyase
MNSLAHTEIKGPWGTLLLPLNTDESIDWKALEKQADYMANSGLSGVYCNGTAGEFYTQTPAEYERLCELISSVCEGAGTPFQIGASHTDCAEMFARIRTAVKYKPGAIQIILPGWFPMKDPEVKRFLERASELAEGIGLVLYNPPCASRVLDPSDIKNLLLPNKAVVGIKGGAGTEEWFAGMQEVFPVLSVFCLPARMATAIGRGVSGAYSNIAAISPKGTAAWYRIIKTDIEKALELEGRVVRFMDEYVLPYTADYSDPALDKLQAAAGNWLPMSTRVRWPYSTAGEKEVRRIREGIEKLIPEMKN